jgi:hypothetical protein
LAEALRGHLRGARSLLLTYLEWGLSY